MIAAADPRWYVAQTKPNAEMRAAQNLARQGFQVYLPRYLKGRRHARRYERTPRPLFPRYLFVNFDAGNMSWRTIRSTIGVTQLICRQETSDPIAISSAVIDDIRQREDERGYVTLSQTPLYRHGDKVRILTGVFRDQVGIFDCCSDAERVRVLVSLLGQNLAAQIHMADLAAAT